MYLTLRSYKSTRLATSCAIHYR